MDTVLVANADVRCMDAPATRAEEALAGARVRTTVIGGAVAAGTDLTAQ